MKKIYLFLAVMLLSCTVTTAFGQATKEERVQAILDKNQQKELYKAELEDAMHGFRQGVEYSIRNFGTLGVILYYDSTLALLALLSAPVTILMSRFLVRKMRDHSEKMRKLSSEMMIFNEESFQNIQLIKGFDLSERYSEKHKAIQDKYKNVALQYNQFSIYKNTIMSLV